MPGSPNSEFASLLRAELAKRGLSARAVARLGGLPDRSVRNILDGHEPSIGRASDVAGALGLEFYIGPPRSENLPLKAPEGETWLSPERLEALESSAQTLNRVVIDAGGDPIPEDLRAALADPGISAEILDLPGARQIGVRELAAAAGGGALELDETVTGCIAFRRDWLDRHGIDPTQCTVIGVEGESMEPTLPDGCSILVDRARRRRLVGHVYVVRSPDDGIVVKRLGKDGAGGWLLGSDHPEWDDPVPWPDGANMIGEVRWVARTFG